MGERITSLTPSDRALEQAIVSLKKGAYILKYSRRSKPKLCPFRLSTDERTLIWFSGKEEKQLHLSLVTSIIRGHPTRKLQPERACHSFSLIYIKNQAQCSLDLICRDKDQADSWFLGLKSLISKSQDFRHLDHQRRAQSCINSPASFIRWKYKLGFQKETTKLAQVGSICASPSLLSDRGFSDGLSYSSDSFYSRSSLSSVHNLNDCIVPHSPCIDHEQPENTPRLAAPFLPQKPKETKLSDVFIWGQGFENGEDANKILSPASFRKQCKQESLSCITVGSSANKNQHKTNLESTVKRKGAKDVIKALTSRLHSISPRAFMRNQAKACVDTQPKNLPSSSAHAVGDSIRSGNSSRLDEPVVKEMVSEENEVKQKPEWVEQYRPGVYITFVMLTTGQKGIKRVRFSRKVFRQREAARWWEQNQQQVYDTYNVDGYINSF